MNTNIIVGCIKAHPIVYNNDTFYQELEPYTQMLVTKLDVCETAYVISYYLMPAKNIGCMYLQKIKIAMSLSIKFVFIQIKAIIIVVTIINWFRQKI